MGAALDLAGQKYGEWTVISRAYATPQDGWSWICQCSCGALEPVVGSLLRRGRTTRCHTCRRKQQLDDLTGRTFGQWTVLEQAPGRNGATLWHVRCTCGNTSIVNGQALKRAQDPAQAHRGSSCCNTCRYKAQAAPAGTRKTA